MYIFAGGCGARASTFSSLPEERVLVVGSRADVLDAEESYTRLTVNAGSPTGAHRDHKTAYRQLLGQEPVNRVLEACKRAFEREIAPVIVYGLAGAVGLALARIISEEIPVVVHAMVLPHPTEPEAERADDKFRWVMAGVQGRSLLVARTPREAYDSNTLAAIVTDIENLEGELHVDRVNNLAATDNHLLDGRRATLETVENRVRAIAERHRAEERARTKAVEVEREKLDVREIVREEKEEEKEEERKDSPWDIF
ncbi:MAG: hypothetical protein ABGY09_03545 [Euryarchaeota archaeon]